jgi:hypothetical protein
MKRKHLFAIVLIFLFVFVASEGKTEQFTFQVPVKLSNLHKDIERARVTCYATNSQNTVLPADAPWQNNVDLNIVGGNYTGTVTVKLNVENPWLAANYNCSFFLKSKYEGNFRNPSTFTTGDLALVSQKASTQGALPKQ